jgi:hypothetical protein
MKQTSSRSPEKRAAAEFVGRRLPLSFDSLAPSEFLPATDIIFLRRRGVQAELSADDGALPCNGFAAILVRCGEATTGVG